MASGRRDKKGVQPIKPGDHFLKGVQADIHPTVRLGKNTVVWSFAVICDGVEVGDNCVIGSLVYIGKGCKIGNNVRIQDKAHITDHMIIEDDVFIGPCAVTMNDRYPVVNNPGYQKEPPILEKGCTIGAGSVILPGVRVGAGSMIGAGAVLTKDACANGIYIGSPAVRSGYLE